ncbi:histidine kinase dimerization/phospho-acceptor domain-containing protein [uncultured Flavobacterium sp.]|uniref:histidine kinase dimerization/phospho-acceptor domain-containing protein n=1 Tax=uncultured Flavobacterium sp. TaxID=165435 RepID=UPI0030EEC47E|tara:strand:- start:155 stop:592 length:438 start_codon:yes stop_codon:yes gene_type:complete
MDSKILNEELIIIKKELAFQNQEKEKRAAELFIANTELLFQNEEKEKRAQELLIANIELKRAQEYQKEYIEGIEMMIYMTSHQIRQPIVNILGLSQLVDFSTDTKVDLKQTLDHIKTSAQSLDELTKELNSYILDLRQKAKNRLI